ncbi:MAG: DUF4933 domain-containing protein [Bacteroidales bacterium]|jgi:hypothetical protein|nr:DUF4933 domain-containing protein [Bacteroidales bacterium]
MPEVISSRFHILSSVARRLPLIFVAGCLSFFSCGGRNPNLSEKQLLALANDTTLLAKEDPSPVLPDAGYVPPAGAKFTENRSVDPVSPPVTLKVSMQGGAGQPLKLSRFGSSVEYVTLKLPGEEDFFLSQTHIHLNGDKWAQSYRSSTQVSKAGDYFVTTDELGIRLFDHQGAFVDNLLLSEFEGKRNAQTVEVEHDSYRPAMLRDVRGDRCYLAVIDYSSKKTWIGEYRLANRPLNDARPEMTQVRNYPAGMYMDGNTRFNFQGGRGSRPVAVSFNTMGDTLCKFANHVRIDRNIRGFASSDRSFFDRADGTLFFRQSYCDTIFRVQSANRIVPAYRFDFGAQRVSMEDGVLAKTQGKLLPWKWIVFKNLMILIFTEGRDCPNCRKAGEVTFHCLLFDRQSGRADAIDMISPYPEDALIENDIDGGLPLPLNSINVRDDGIFASFTKGQIEEILKNSAKTIPAETVLKLKTQADVLKSNEMLVMVVR